MLPKNRKRENWSNKPVFRFCKKKSSALSRVVWVEKSKNGIRFEIGSNYDDAPTTSQLLIDGKFSCTAKSSVFDIFRNDPE